MRTVFWENGVVHLIDQTRLPAEIVVVHCATYGQVAQAIKEMRIRGAPAIGVAAAFGYALAATASPATTVEALLPDLEQAWETLRQTRPTAVNLFWALDRMRRKAQTLAHETGDVAAIRAGLVDEAQRMADEDVETNMRMAALGAEFIKDGDTILTHCNAGGLATVDYGTALGVIRRAHEQGKRIHVLVDETRPFLQGARLTTWELLQLRIPMTLITDNMAGGKVHAVVVGADRIAANGDVANKIGTYTLAVLAKEHSIPFYVVAPTSTIDLSLPTGDSIPIEERDPEEVTTIRGIRICPEGVPAAHPAFDVTPHRLVTAIITERGIARPPYVEGLARMVHPRGS